MRTPWGYSIDTDALQDIITVEEFDAMTGGRYHGDTRVAGGINSASGTVRAYCGWHVAPALPCTLPLRALDKRVSVSGPDMLIQLPAAGDITVQSVEIGGEAVEDYDLEVNILRLFDTGWIRRKTEIVIHYTAGLSGPFGAMVQEVVGERVTHGVAQSYGITTEQAGGVSVTYNASWTSGGGASALSELNMRALEPYRLQGVF